MNLAREPLERLKRWPDCFEVYEVDGRREYVAVIEQPSRFEQPPELFSLCQHLEDCGIKVVVRVLDEDPKLFWDFTVDEFEAGGAYAVRPILFKSQSISWHRSRLSELRAQLAVTPEDTLRYENIARRIERAEAAIRNALNPAPVEVKSRANLDMKLLRKLVSEEMETNDDCG